MFANKFFNNVVFVILSIICMATIMACDNPEKELYLIPANFQGRFRVIYGEHCGIMPKYEHGRRVMEIPANGILIIQPLFKAGTVDNEYYVLDKSGKREKLKEVISTANTNNIKGVELLSTGSIGGAMPDGSMSSESPLAIHFADFIVYNGNDSTTTFSQLDSLTNTLVTQCRGKK